MNFRKVALPVAVAFAAVAMLSLPALAAMPVSGATQLSDKSPVIQVAKKKKRMTRQQELDQSIDSGTVPSRYRANVPREYQQYVPFAKQ